MPVITKVYLMYFVYHIYLLDFVDILSFNEQLKLFTDFGKGHLFSISFFLCNNRVTFQIHLWSMNMHILAQKSIIFRSTTLIAFYFINGWYLVQETTLILILRLFDL